MPLTQDQADVTREEWEARQWRRRIAVLGNGVKYQQVTMSPVDAAVGQMMMLSNTQVAHMLELPGGDVGRPVGRVDDLREHQRRPP